MIDELTLQEICKHGELKTYTAYFQNIAVGEIVMSDISDYRWTASSPILLIPRSYTGQALSLDEAKHNMAKYVRYFANKHAIRRQQTIEEIFERICNSGFAVKVMRDVYPESTHPLTWCAQGWISKHDRRNQPDFVAYGFDEIKLALLALEISLEALSGKYASHQPAPPITAFSALEAPAED